MVFVTLRLDLLVSDAVRLEAVTKVSLSWRIVPSTHLEEVGAAFPTRRILNTQGAYEFFGCFESGLIEREREATKGPRLLQNMSTVGTPDKRDGQIAVRSVDCSKGVLFRRYGNR